MITPPVRAQAGDRRCQATERGVVAARIRWGRARQRGLRLVLYLPARAGYWYPGQTRRLFGSVS
jgi:hypothetical protein